MGCRRTDLRVANNSSRDPSLSADGTKVAFWSDASNLDPADTDSVSDVYMKEPGEQASGADLSVAKRDGRDPVPTGRRLVYTVSVDNLGPDQATGVTITGTLPHRALFVSASPSQGTCSRNVRMR